MIQILWQRLTTFLGRNGTFKCGGIDLVTIERHHEVVVPTTGNDIEEKGECMNAGTKRYLALEQALANARANGQPRFLHKYGGVYWIEDNPPAPGPMAGAYGSDYVIVFPEGDYQTYDPVQGVADVLSHRPTNQKRTGSG